MSPCRGPGRPDMYGLGIRLGFYCQWFGEMFNNHADVADVADIRFLGVLLTSAVLLGVIAQWSSGSHLDPADVYIVLLLAAGTYVFFIPLYVWRLFTCCDPAWDPLGWSRAISLPIYDVAAFILLLCLSSIGLWFYATHLPKRGPECEQYGFLFSPIELGNKKFAGINSIVYLTIILICVGMVLSRAGCWESRKRRRHPGISVEQRIMLRLLRSLSNGTVYTLHVASIELTIRWNQLTNVNSLGTVAQTLPFLLSAGIVLRAVFCHFSTMAAEASSDSGTVTRRGLPQSPWWEEADHQTSPRGLTRPTAAYTRSRTR